MFLKSLLLNFKRKIGEPILIFLTVALAVAAFVSAVALRESIEREAVGSYLALSGRAEIEAVYEGEEASFYLTGGSKELEELRLAADKVGVLHSGYYFYASALSNEDSFARVYATDISDLVSYDPVSVLSGELLPLRTGVAVSRSFAKKIGVSVGGEIVLSRFGSDQKAVLTALAICADEGPFSAADLIVSESAASRLVSIGDGVTVYNEFFIELSKEKLKAVNLVAEGATAFLREAAPSFSFASPVNEENVKTTLTYQSTLVAVIAALVAVIGSVLIFSAVSLVMRNRISLCALFMSAGATRSRLFVYLSAEILLYSLPGAAAGVGLSYLLSAAFALVGDLAVGTISVSPLLAFCGVLFGVCLAFASSLVPVLKLSGTSLYDALHFSSPVAKDSLLPPLLSALAFLGCFLAVGLSSVKASLVAGILSFAATFAFILCLAPLAVKGVSCVLMRLTASSKAGALYVASSVASKQKHVRAGARIIAVSVAAVAAVTALCGEAADRLEGFESLFVPDVSVSCAGSDATALIDPIRAEEGVNGAYLAFLETKCPLSSGSGTVTLVAVRAKDAGSALDLSSFGFSYADVAGAGKAAVGRGLAMKMGLEIGDTFALKVNGEFLSLSVAALFDSPITVVFTDLSGLGTSPNTILVETKDGGAFDRLSEKYSLVAAVNRIRDVFSYATSLARSYLKIFRVFSVFVILFALVGYVNALAASIRDRKREFKVLRAVGAGRGERAKLLAIENALVTLTSGALGAAFSFALLFIVQNMLKYFGVYFSIL